MAYLRPSQRPVFLRFACVAICDSAQAEGAITHRDRAGRESQDLKTLGPGAVTRPRDP